MMVITTVAQEKNDVKSAVKNLYKISKSCKNTIHTIPKINSNFSARIVGT